MLESVVGKLTARVFYEVPDRVKNTGLKEPLVTMDADAAGTGDYSVSERVDKRQKQAKRTKDGS